MAEHTAKSKRANAVVKIALIPVLVLALAAVLLWPDKDSDTLATGPESQQAESPAAAEISPQAAARSERAIAVERRRKQVDEMELSLILEHDPFAVSRTLSKELSRDKPEAVEANLAEAARAQRIEEVVKSLQTERVNAIFHGEDGVSAVLGSRIIHEGDVIDDGVRVIEITPDGLILEVITD